MKTRPSFVTLAVAGLAFAIAPKTSAGELYRTLGPTDLRASHLAAGAALAIEVDPAALADRQLVLPLPGRAPVEANLQQLERRGAGNLTWRGFAGAEERVVLTWASGYLVGLIHAGGEAYEIVTTADGGQALNRLDSGRFPGCLDAVPAVEPEATTGEVPTAAKAAISADPANDIDLLGLYTPQARDAAGGVAQIEATLQGAVDMANTAFIDSEMIARFDLVHTALATRNDSGDMSADLTWVRTDAGVAALRDQVAADLVSLVVNSGSACGVGYVMRSPGPGFAASAFQVTARSCAVGNLSFAHEHGHNMGFEHDPANGTTPASASFLWSFGHFVDGSYRTVMSYSSECTAGCTRVAHFSNPDILHNGVPTGIADQRDNARSGDLTAAIVANFRDGEALATIFEDGFESGNLSGWSSSLP